MLGRGATACAALLITAGGLQAQRPLVGGGAVGGIFLGSRLTEHVFTAERAGEQLRLTQQIDLYEVPLTSVHGEWYVTPHIALRAHTAWGRGDLEVSTLARTAGSPAFGVVESAFGTVSMQALDAGVSVWPWAPRSTGLTPFVTMGVGTVRYAFDSGIRYPGSFRPAGARTRDAFLVGIGADMEVWRWLMLRMEAINHRVDPPLEDGDFTAGGETVSAAPGSETLSNVRLVLGAHMYFPFGKSRSLE